MKTIKTKPTTGSHRVMDKAVVIPKTAARKAWLASKQQSMAQVKNTPFAAQREASANVQTLDAAEQWATDARSTVSEAVGTVYNGGKRLVKTAARKSAVKRALAQVTHTGAAHGTQPAQTMFRGTKAAAKNGRKADGKRIKTAGKAAQAVKQMPAAAARNIQWVQRSAQAAAHSMKAIAHGIGAGVKALWAGLQSLWAALAAGGGVAVMVVVLICLIALVVGSAFGIFFGAQPTGRGTSIPQAITMLNGEYQAQMVKIAADIPHDRQEITAGDGKTAIAWEDVLAVFSARVSGSAQGAQVASLDTMQMDLLREVLWDMNEIWHTVREESYTAEVTKTDGEGKEYAAEETVSETILEITITHKTPAQMAQAYGFTARQNEYLALLSETENTALWAELLGSFVNGNGQILKPGGGRQGTGPLQWPLTVPGSITSHFGYRQDPFTGKTDYHSGTDIAAPDGIPILAAAGGTVTIANSLDAWGGSYGYHVKLDHGGELETLYAHCSAICVTAGRQVKQGEVIGYVGSTGNSTGNHLHFEVWQNGQRVDAQIYFNISEK